MPASRFRTAIPVALAMALSPAAQALTEEEILRRFEEYERRIEALEAELRAVKAGKTTAAAPVATPEPTAQSASDKKLARLERQVTSMQRAFRQEEGRLQLNGFASAGVATSNVSQQLNTQIHDDWDFNADSVFGLQANFRVNKKTQFVSQFVARGVDEARSEDEFDARVEWAYLSYQHRPDLKLRAGRLRLPIFMISEYQEVGYTYPWARPPSEVYGLVGQFTAYDGFDVLYDLPLRGGWHANLQAYWGGRASTVLLAGSSIGVDLDDAVGVNVRLNYRDLDLFAGYNRADLSFSTLPASLATAEAALNAFAGQTLTVRKEDLTFKALGWHYDDGDWLFMGEYTIFNIDEWLIDTEAYYATVGHHFGRFLPHFTFGKLNTTDGSNRIFPAPVGNLRNAPTFLDAEQSSWTLGLRYDHMPGIALKFEWQRIADLNGTAGLFTAPPGKDVDVWSFVIDTVF